MIRRKTKSAAPLELRNAFIHRERAKEIERKTGWVAERKPTANCRVFPSRSTLIHICSCLDLPSFFFRCSYVGRNTKSRVILETPEKPLLIRKKVRTMKTFKLAIPSEEELPRKLRITLPEHNDIEVEIQFSTATNRKVVQVELDSEVVTTLNGSDDR